MQAAGSLGLTRGAGGAGGGNPFFRLLRAYLQHFLPRPAPGALTPPRPGSEQQRCVCIFMLSSDYIFAVDGPAMGLWGWACY